MKNLKIKESKENFETNNITELLNWTHNYGAITIKDKEGRMYKIELIDKLND